jgi:hypothetical protein
MPLHETTLLDAAHDYTSHEMDEPNDLPLTKGDSHGAPMSVIAACIERFRNQAPTPSNARSQIPAGKFWWLDANPPKDVIEPAPRPLTNLVERGTAERYRSTSPLYESDDESTSDGDIHFQKIVPKTLIRSDVDRYGPLEDISATELMFSSDSTDHDLKAAFNLDSYAEKLLMKCDLLLKGYDKPKEHRLSDESTGLRRTKMDNRDHYTRSDSIENSRVSSLGGKRQGGLTTLSQETISEEDSISLNKIEYSTDGRHGASNKKHSQLDFHRPSQSLNLSDSIDSLPMSPLGLSLAFSADSWSGLQVQGMNVPASTVIDSRNHPVTEKTAVVYEMDAAADVEHRVITGTERMGSERTGTGASHAAIEKKELGIGSGQLTRRSGLETIDECSNDVSICNDDGFEPNLSESVTFPYLSAERPVTSKSRADSLLYVSSSSEGDFISKAKVAHAGRHWGGVNVNESGDSTSDKGGRESALDADPDAAFEQFVESDVVHCTSDDDNDRDHSAEGSSDDDNDRDHSAEGSSEDDNDRDHSAEGSSEDDNDRDHSPEGSCDDAPDAGDIYSFDGAEGSVQDPPVSDSVVSGVIDASTSASQSASCASVSNGNALQTPVLSDSVPCPLAESDVAPFLKDEITAMLWARLCKIREQMAAAETAACIQ